MTLDTRPIRQSVSKGSGGVKMLSGALPNGTYYIYSFDGRLLAEYDVSGAWIMDYIYFCGQLVAEYRADVPVPKYYFYASDQINSTRIVTDSDGTVVYSAAHEPYGGIQKTWTADIDPELKFSGKPRDPESELDYFGARYYDRAEYRFLSVDPVIPAGKAVANPQRWNLYAYCLGNPVSFLDPAGEDPFRLTIIRIAFDTNYNACYGQLTVNGVFQGNTLENDMWKLRPGTYSGYLEKFRGHWVIKIDHWRPNYIYPDFRIEGRRPAIISGASDVNVMHECIAIGSQPGKNGMIGPDNLLNDIKDEYLKYLENLIRSTEQGSALLASAQSGILDRCSSYTPLGMVLAAWFIHDIFGYIVDNLENLQIEITIVEKIAGGNI